MKVNSLFSLIILSFFILVFTSCNQNSQNKLVIQGDTLKNEYAKGFQIIKKGAYTYLNITNPWQNANSITVQYCLGSEKPKDLNQNIVFIQTPVQKVICMSTTHIAFIDALSQLKSIKGISGKNLVNNKFIRNEVETGNIPDIGYEQNLNYEIIASIKPDVVFAYSVGSEISGVISKLKSLNIPVVVVAEYLENEALAKAEWIKFMATFYQKEEFAVNLFDSINIQYKNTKELANKASKRPVIMSSMPWNGTWYISGGQTYMGRLIADANADYIWKDITSRESVPMDYEYAFQRSMNADIWLNLGSSENIQDVLNTDSRLAAFKAIKTKMMFNNNARTNASGGNDYWESGTMNPQLILKDLIHIFHPELIPEYKLYYYQQLK